MIVILLGLLQAAATTGPTVTVEGAKPERKICRTAESTGSRMGGTRTCHTPSEWRALQGPLDARTVNGSMNTGGYGGLGKPGGMDTLSSAPPTFRNQ